MVSVFVFNRCHVLYFLCYVHTLWNIGAPGIIHIPVTFLCIWLDFKKEATWRRNPDTRTPEFQTGYYPAVSCGTLRGSFVLSGQQEVMTHDLWHSFCSKILFFGAVHWSFHTLYYTTSNYNFVPLEKCNLLSTPLGQGLQMFFVVKSRFDAVNPRWDCDLKGQVTVLFIKNAIDFNSLLNFI